ncbi:MAG: ATP-dependent dethiobiotin synthetase BioD [Desulfobulbus sp.]|nr:ATP-dependent dethiobiotin synthetase BioD [Desulfobulbus sp.]
MIMCQQTIAITGIDTDVGKSYVTGLLARYLLNEGESAGTMKLVQTGCQGISEDIQLHRKLMGQPLTEFDETGTTCPYVFPYPSSPRLASRMAGTPIETDRLDEAMTTLQKQYQWLLVEGAGGLLVPLNEHLLLLDYFAAKQLPMVLVTSPRLGSINHTRLSIEAMKHRNIRLLGLVYNLFGAHPPDIVQDTLYESRRALADYDYPATIVLMADIRESSACAWAPLLSGIPVDKS